MKTVNVPDLNRQALPFSMFEYIGRLRNLSPDRGKQKRAAEVHKHQSFVTAAPSPPRARISGLPIRRNRRNVAFAPARARRYPNCRPPSDNPHMVYQLSITDRQFSKKLRYSKVRRRRTIELKSVTALQYPTENRPYLAILPDTLQSIDITTSTDMTFVKRFVIGLALR